MRTIAVITVMRGTTVLAPGQKKARYPTNKIAQCRKHRRPCEPKKPADLEARHTAEGFPRIEVRTTGVFKTAGQFSETQDDQNDGNGTNEICKKAVSVRQCEYSGRKTENT